ncbi:MAG: hypothetical protein OEO21_02475 [Candidatus Krumholzibacteria bacterium]|nr:hypothetical protein [Candidatus Krumholzibacteria bacterium]
MTAWRLLLLLVLAVTFVAPAHATRWSAGGQVGYNDGPGAFAYGMVSEFATGLPLALRLGAGYTSVAPGSALDARRVFINDATNGTPEKSAHRWDARLDMLYRLPFAGWDRFHALGGVRYLHHTSDFKFIGGNEFFNITSKQWGLGLGMDAMFAMGAKADFVMGGGLDYFFDANLTGHDTAYSPDGEHVNARAEYSYADADDAINQPSLEFRFMIGVNYRFGR